MGTNSYSSCPSFSSTSSGSNSISIGYASNPISNLASSSTSKKDKEKKDKNKAKKIERKQLLVSDKVQPKPITNITKNPKVPEPILKAVTDKILVNAKITAEKQNGEQDKNE